jgi:hypothetical protein
MLYGSNKRTSTLARQYVELSARTNRTRLLPRQHHHVCERPKKNVEGEILPPSRFERLTPALQVRCSTPELRGHEDVKSHLSNYRNVQSALDLEQSALFNNVWTPVRQ